MNANGLAPAGPGWAAGVPTVPIDPHSHNSMGWVERNDVEYWPPDNLDAQVPVFDFPGSNVYLKPSLPSIIQVDPETAGMEPQQLM